MSVKQRLDLVHVAVIISSADLGPSCLVLAPIDGISSKFFTCPRWTAIYIVPDLVLIEWYLIQFYGGMGAKSEVSSFVMGRMEIRGRKRPTILPCRSKKWSRIKWSKLCVFCFQFFSFNSKMHLKMVFQAYSFACASSTGKWFDTFWSNFLWSEPCFRTR